MCKLVILAIVIVLFFIIVFGSYSERYIVPLVSGRPPPIGDFLPTVGEVPTGSGNFVDESGGVSYQEATLCRECINNCMGWSASNGIRPGDKHRCVAHCGIECNPVYGL